MPVRLCILAATLLAVLLAGGSAPAAIAAPAPIRDVILEEGSLEGRSFGSEYRDYADGDGHTVRIDRGVFSEADAQVVVEQLARLVHSDEMDRLSVVMVTGVEMELVCGPGVLACYEPRSEEMVIAGDDSTKPPSRAFIVAHEYGHHVAVNRLNDPWKALDWGTKRWATQERVCPGVRRGSYQPGAYGQESYYDNPGEAYAEAYAFLHYPDEVRWDWDLPAPDRGSYAAIRSDVVDPWTGPQRLLIQDRLRKGEERDRRRLRTPLDGELIVRLRAPKRTRFDLRLLAGNRRKTLARTRARRGRAKLAHEVCGQRKLHLQITSRRGKGSYELRVRRP